METRKFSVLYLWLWCTIATASETSNMLDPLRHLDLKITLKTCRNDAGHLTSQVRVEEELGKTDSCEHLHHDRGSGSQCTKEHPRPFYELVPGLGYLKLHNRPKTWNEAKIACEKEGAHLGILNSETELEALRELRARLPSHYKDWRDSVVHVGVTDSQEEGTWLTIFGKPFSDTGYTKWGTNEPGGGVNENCMAVFVDSGVLVDAGCGSTFAFYCEKET
ncbi:hemolymph lipopolysaccharide-binding protein-like [Periplaneta americana]|uniref:hemolymph lipopolysaccharide-binding protein-like n=1 Tax=Periplaneta americana TaxID=6978 RepID=UPI0037E933FB